MPEKYLVADVQYPTPYTKVIQFETDYDVEEETDEESLILELREKAQAYLEKNKIPKVSYEVKSNINQELNLGEKIHIKHPLVTILTEVIEYEYNTNTKRVSKLVFGNYVRDVKTSFLDYKQNLDNISQQSIKQFDSINKLDSRSLEILTELGLINLSIEDIINLKRTKSQENNLYISNIRTGKGYIVSFSIIGNTTNFTTNHITLVASKRQKNLIDDISTEDRENLFTENSENIVTEKKTFYLEEKSIQLDAPLRNLIIEENNLYDELKIFQDGSIQIIRRIGIDENDNLYLLDEPEVKTLNDSFILPSYEGSSYYFIDELDNLLYEAEYIVKSEYSDYLATKAELSAGLKLKIDRDKMISELNASADIIRLIGERLIILMQNYSLNEKGYMMAKLGEIAGFLFSDNKFSKEYNSNYNFTVQDVQLLVGFLDGYNSLVSGLQSLYELTEDGNLNVTDIVKMINIINGNAENPKTCSGTVAINSDDSNRLIEIINNLNVNKTRFGIFSIYAYLLSADVISLTEYVGTEIIGIILDKVKKQITVKDANNETTIIPSGIRTPTLTQTSREEDKKNFEHLKSALEEVLKTDIYKYNLKSETDNTKKHIGFVIGEEFNYSHLITAEDEKGNEIGVEDYSMISVLWQAFKEYVAKTDDEIKKLKEKL